MDPVNTALLDAVSTDFLTEAGGVRCECLGDLVLVNDSVDELTDHGVLGSTDEVEIFALDLVHHVLHLCKAHNACNNRRSDHVRRNVICESSIDHEVTCIREACGMESCDVALKIVEAVAGCFSCLVELDTVKLFHDINVIRNFEIGNEGLAELLDLYILGIVFTDRNGRIDDVRDNEHDLSDLFFELCLLLGKSFELVSHVSDLLLNDFGFFLFALCHESADLLADLVAVSS